MHGVAHTVLETHCMAKGQVISTVLQGPQVVQQWHDQHSQQHTMATAQERFCAHDKSVHLLHKILAISGCCFVAVDRLLC